MWKCSNCAHRNQEDANFCIRCSAKRPTASKHAGLPARRRGVAWLYGLCGGALLLAAVMLWLYFSGGTGLLSGLTAPFAPTEESAPNEAPAPTEASAPTEAPLPTEAPAPTEAPVPTASTQTDDFGMLGRFSLAALDGRTVDDASFAGNRLTMVNFWATWCGPCVGEIPDLQRLADHYADEGFGIVGVLVWDENIEGALDFLQSGGIDYPTVMPEGPFEQLSAGFDAIPATLFFDSAGNQVGEVYVGSRSYEDWTSLVGTLLDQLP